jgi:hypothetical protein
MIGREHIEMKNGFVRKFAREPLKQMREWYRGRIWAFDDIENNAEKILDRAINVTRKFSVKVWILDNLMCLDINAKGDSDQWIRQKEFIVKLVSLAKTYNVLIVLIAHPRKMNNIEIDRRLSTDDVSGSNDLGNLAQYIVSVHRFSKKEKEGEKNGKGTYKSGKEPIKHDVVVDILKNRYTGKIGEALFYFDYFSYKFFNTPQELWRRYGWDKNTSPLRTDNPNNSGEIPEGFGE